MVKRPDSDDRRGFLKKAGAAFAGGLGAVAAGSDRANAADSKSAPDPDTSPESVADPGHYVEIPLGTDVRYNRLNNWSAPVDESGELAGAIPGGNWSRTAMVREGPINVVEAIYGESGDPRQFITTTASSRGGAGPIAADAWGGLEFYTTGAAARTATIYASAAYDVGMNYLQIREGPGMGYAGNTLDMVVTDLSSGGQELARAPIWRHEGVGENYTTHNQAEAIAWPYNGVTVTLNPNRYYAVYYVQRALANSVSPIKEVTDGIYPSEAIANQHAGVGSIRIIS